MTDAEFDAWYEVQRQKYTNPHDPRSIVAAANAHFAAHLAPLMAEAKVVARTKHDPNSSLSQNIKAKANAAKAKRLARDKRYPFGNELLTVKLIAKRTGIPYRTLWGWLKKYGEPEALRMAEAGKRPRRGAPPGTRAIGY